MKRERGFGGVFFKASEWYWEETWLRLTLGTV